ncbi:MAG: hypothetical protein M0Z59_06610 [Nitrospiraceae bacterium]|nr:hypothetical protein [Nitrospiraceae bacterium]
MIRAASKRILLCLVAALAFFSPVRPAVCAQDFPPQYAQEGYGAKRPVKDISEAKKALLGHFKGRDVTIGKITEKKLFFQAPIYGKNGKLVDMVIVDKRTGRIRSIF